MAEFYSGSISISKIKLRWSEPYTSEGANRQLTVHPPGIYRGGSSGPMPTPSQSFRIGPNADGAGLFVDSLFVTWDEANGLSVVVLDQDLVTVDMSTRFSGGGGSMPGDETWWVWQEAVYATGVPSTAAYKVTDTTPPAGANIIAKIEMLTGDTTIVEARFDKTVKSLPLPTKREDGAYIAGDQWYGVLTGEEAWNIPTSNQKRAMNNAPSAPTASNPFVTKADTLDIYFGEPVNVPVSFSGTKSQMTGVFYFGTSGSTPYHFLNACKYDTSVRRMIPYDNGIGGKLIQITSVRKNDDSGVLNPSVDCDALGFYTNPYIEISESVSGVIDVRAYAKKTFSNLDQTPALLVPPLGLNEIFHASKMPVAREVTTSPDTLVSTNVEGQLLELLGHVNNRIRPTDDVNISGVYEFEGDSGSIQHIDQSRFSSVPYVNSLQGGSVPPGMSPRHIAMNALGFRGGAQEANRWGYAQSTLNSFIQGGAADACIVVKDDASGIPQRYLCVLDDGGVNECSLQFYDVASRQEYSSWAFDLESHLPAGTNYTPVACGSDGDTVCCLFEHSTNGYVIQAYDWVNKTRKSGWPSTGRVLSGSYTTSGENSDRKMVIINGTYLAVNNYWRTITSGSVYAISILTLANGTLTEGNGDYAGAYGASVRPTGICSDGEFVYFGCLSAGGNYLLCSLNPTSPSSGSGKTGLPGTLSGRAEELVCTGEQIIVISDAAGIDLYPFDGTTPAMVTIPDTGGYLKHPLRGSFDGENVWIADMDAIQFPSASGSGIALHKIPASALMSTTEVGDSGVKTYLMHSEKETGTTYSYGFRPLGRVFFDGDSVWMLLSYKDSTRKIRRIPRAMYR